MAVSKLSERKRALERIFLCSYIPILLPRIVNFGSPPSDVVAWRQVYVQAYDLIASVLSKKYGVWSSSAGRCPKMPVIQTLFYFDKFQLLYNSNSWDLNKQFINTRRPTWDMFLSFSEPFKFKNVIIGCTLLSFFRYVQLKLFLFFRVRIKLPSLRNPYKVFSMKVMMKRRRCHLKLKWGWEILEGKNISSN